MPRAASPRHRLRPVATLLVAAAVACTDDADLTKLRSSLRVEPAAIDLGDREVDTDARATVRLSNDGSRALQITAVRLETGAPALTLTGAPAQGSPLRVEPKSTAEVIVRYSPLVAGATSDALLIDSDADDNAKPRVPITARAFDPCVDQDADGYGDHCRAGPDCDDRDRRKNPGAIERCDGADEDCDGVPDDGFDLGADCTATVDLAAGPCSRPGRKICARDGSGAACEPLPVEDRCDGTDNDCNGVRDDRWTATLGSSCRVDEANGCHRAGALACNASGTGTECRADASAPLSCCDAGLEQNPSGVCCAPLPAGPCRMTCNVDVIQGTHDCASPVVVSALESSMALLTIDMTGYSHLELRVHACTPTGDWLDIADSPTCNGFGGDGSSSSNDAEVHANNAVLGVYANDFVTAPAASPLGTLPLPINGCEERVLSFSDSRVQTFDPCLDIASPYALRINPPQDMEGTPDGLWYVGLNRVVSDIYRSGTGLKSATLCLR